MEVTELYWIRHGEVDVKYHYTFGGTIDMDLSPHGAMQAEQTAEYLKNVGWDSLYCSPMKRARQTLAPILERSKSVRERNIQPNIIPGLREIDFGIWTGKTWKQVYEEHGVAHEWVAALEAGTVDKAEKMDDFRERVSAGIDQIRSENHGKTVAIVCHGGVIRMALSILLKDHGLPMRATSGMEIEYASVTRVNLFENKASIELMNLTPWRDLA